MNREAECIDSQDTNQDTREVDIKLYEYASSFNKYLCEKMTLHEENYVTFLFKKKFPRKLTAIRDQVYLMASWQGRGPRGKIT